MNRRSRQLLTGVLAAGIVMNAVLPGGQAADADEGAAAVVSVLPGTPYKADGTYDVTVPHVIINQVYGGGTSSATDTYISNGFIELYNPTDADIALTGWSIHYAYAADPTTGISGDWQKLSLSGTIKAKSYYLVSAAPTGASAANVKADISTPDKYDIAWPDTFINNKALKVVLLSNDAALATDNKNPFAAKTAGYVDMLGTSGNDSDTKIDGYETAHPSGKPNANSKKIGLRRQGFTDTDNNKMDFVPIDYSSAATPIADVRPHSGKELKLAVTTALLPGATAGKAYSAVIEAEGGTKPYTFAGSALPEGLALDPATGALTGTPTSAGSVDVTFTVTDGAQTPAAATKTLTLAVSAAPTHTYEDQFTLRKLSEYSVGTTNADGGVAEIVKYNADNGKFYLVNGSGNPPSLEIVKLEADGKLTHERTIEVKALSETDGFAYGDLTSVDVNTAVDRIFVAVQEAGAAKAGKILELDYDGNLVKAYDSGIQPDMVKSTPDGRYVLTANEGEPRTSKIDPEGGVTIVDRQAGTSSQAKFDKPAIIDESVHIRGTSETGQILGEGRNEHAVFDLEPEYITLSADNKIAYISLQENNAIAVLDIATKEFTAVKGLGFKDWSDPANVIDVAKDKTIKLENVPFKGMYMPDGLASFSAGDKTYILSANEGDVTEWEDREEGTPDRKNGKKLSAVKGSLDPNSEAAKFLNGKTAYDGIEVATDMGNDGVYMFGGRSFSIWDASTLGQVYDSGSEFEQITAQRLPDRFNASNDDVELDSRSAKKGPEPEDIKAGKVGSRTIAFVGLERVGGIMAYDVTDPAKPVFANYTNTREFNSAKAEDTDTAPEGIEFIPAENSPTGRPLLLVAYEVGGRVSVLELNVAKVTMDRKTLALTAGGAAGKLSATVEPVGGGEATVTWTSSNSSVATVDASGKVSPVAAGTAVITAVSADGFGSAQSVVTVTAPTTYVPGPGTTGAANGNTVTASTQDGITTATIAVKTAAANGQATAEVGEAAMTEALAKLGGAAASALELQATDAGDARQISFKVTAAALAKLAGASVPTVKLSAGVAAITLDRAAIQAIVKTAGSGDVTITAARAADGGLTGESAILIGSRPVVDLTIAGGGKTVDSFDGGSAKVSIPYAPAAGEDPNAIVVYYVDAGGQLKTVANGRYDAATGTVSFTSSHFSRYAIGYNRVAFGDANGSFASSSITYLSARGVINGVAEGKFAPERQVSRADFALLLARLAGADASAAGGTDFADVKPGAYYAGAVGWALDAGIVSGVSKDRFNPHAPITREQMAVMIARFAEAVGYELPRNAQAAAFQDAGAVSPFAADAVDALLAAGLLGGKPADGGTVFAPKKTTTRAEAAVLLASLLQGMAR
ncbi:choice-of-anchor I family protein [Paenibacillus methanolicus]|uniref:S-layer family protein n=1 Tax=Paenibacillus methanolicus TaxID=582686 RepID=A0A5S5CDK1_9BACL|nr:choice-of-anchor I family protein [Paenibacillus methanolicus]TYP76430.1 S-layer family protein [Paenibacillus methanolicus]